MIIVRILLSIVIGLFAAALTWAVGMFIWSGYYSFWEGHDELWGAGMTRTMMALMFFATAIVAYTVLDD